MARGPARAPRPGPKQRTKRRDSSSEEGMPQSRRRVRKVPTLTRLPRRGYVIQEKHLRRFRSLAVRPGATYAGLVHMGEDGNEIWVEAGLSDAEKRFTIVHELVHARRQRAGEELIDDSL